MPWPGAAVRLSRRALNASARPWRKLCPAGPSYTAPPSLGGDSLPLLDGADQTWNTLQQLTTHQNDYSRNFKFQVPELRVGTLDSLMVLSDDLVKVNALVEAVVNKVRRQLFELSSTTGDEMGEVLVEGSTPEAYLERFAWDEAKYPPRRPLKETVEAITETIQQLEDNLKIRVSEFNQVKGQVSALNRKATGTLAVRDLAGVVSPTDVISTENLVTLFVVVSKHSQREFMGTYETLSEFVVPRSARVLSEDSDYVLISVTLFRRVADTFKANCRTKGFQVRDFELDEEKQASVEEATTKLREDAEDKKKHLEMWSMTAYGEAFSAWIHICAIRLFVESILRYGLPPRFLAALLKPKAKAVPKLRKVLASTFGAAGGTHFEGDGGTAAGLAVEGEMYPYVSFTLSID